MSLTSESAATADNNPLTDVEAQMRRALGLYGGIRPRQDNDRGEQPGRMMDRFGPQGGNQGGGHQGLHRRRFVQDGEIPVTVVRRDSAIDHTAPAPQSSRLQRTEAALAAETAARDRAERALTDAQAQIAALQTKIGHAELSRAEAVEAARREREAAAALRESSEGFDEQIQLLQDQVDAWEQAKRTAQAALADERAARKAAERALREATERADRAESAMALLDQEREAEGEPVPEPVPVTRRRAQARMPVTAPVPAARHADVKTPARRGRPPGSKSVVKPAVHSVQEPEPVKWWLLPTPKAKGR